VPLDAAQWALRLARVLPSKVAAERRVRRHDDVELRREPLLVADPAVRRRL
jgi:hypothetical protein